MKEISSAPYAVSVYLAGDITDAKRILRQACMEIGLCVTVTPTTYIYTGGFEEGYVVGLVNYPRFQKEPSEVWAQAVGVAKRLIKETCQWSALVQAVDRVVWLTDRPEDQK